MAKSKRHGPRPDRVVRVEMLVAPKPEVPDPVRASILANLQAHGYEQVKGATQAKFFQLKFIGVTLRKARSDANAIGGKLLANPVTEVFEILKVEPVKAS